MQKGIQPGKVIVGYVQDATDASQCSAVTDDPAKKEEFTKNAPELARMMKGTIVPSFPTDNVVDTCNAGFEMLINYSGPKYTKESAQKACVSQPHATWIDQAPPASRPKLPRRSSLGFSRTHPLEPFPPKKHAP